MAGASFEGGWGAVTPPRKKKKRKKERKKRKKRKKRKEKKERKMGTMNNVKLLHIKCCFFQFFNSPVALKNQKKIWPPQEKIEMTPLLHGSLFWCLTWFIFCASAGLHHHHIYHIQFIDRFLTGSMYNVYIGEFMQPIHIKNHPDRQGS